MDNKTPEIAKAHQAEISRVQAMLSPFGMEPLPQFLNQLVNMQNGNMATAKADFMPTLKSLETGALAEANAVARHVRNSWRDPGARMYKAAHELVSKASMETIRKATLDVGSLTNLANVTGGQSLGLISLDTRMARGTVRPKSFTLYHALSKSMAFQVVDYWAYASDVGGGLPGTVFNSYQSQTSGTLNPNAGSYQLKFLQLKLTVDPRAITMALAQQNSFVNVAEQESTNAALNTLTSIEWSIYWGNPALYPNQPQGLAGLIPNANTVDFWSYYLGAPTGAGITTEQALFNLIYEQAGYISSWRQFGQITHAFMTPAVIGDMQSLITGQLRTISNDISETMRQTRAVVIDGELRGMNTAFGDIAFSLDFFITARDVAAQAQLHEIDNTDFTIALLPVPTLALAAVASGNANAAGSDFFGGYVPSGGGKYYYAAVGADQFSNESAMGFAGPVTVQSGGAVGVTVTPAAGSVAAGITAFRIFRSGIGFDGSPGTWTNASNPNGSFPNPAAFKFIGDIAANGAAAVIFYDKNLHIPGSESIFLLDLDEQDQALDYRTLLPISKIELFSGSLYMPWAIASIGAIRVRVPKYHGRIKNYVPVNAQWNPLNPNTNAQPLV